MTPISQKEASHDGDRLPASSSVATVVERYRSLQEDQKSVAEKIFIDGYELRDLDCNLVFLDEQRAEHPRTWSTEKKIRTSLIVGFYCFLSPFASTIFAPSVHQVMASLNIHNSIIGALQVSIFLFSYGIAPLVLAPLSEIYGRGVILHGGTALFSAFSLGGGFAQNAAQLAVCRFMAGLGGSSALATVGGVITDIWDLKARPKAQGLILLGPILGPILGPVCGGWMSEFASWRWTMWVPAIAGGLMVVIGLLLFPETYGPVILQKKARRKKADRPDAPLYTVLDLEDRPKTLGYLVSQFARPVVYLLIDPALFLCSFYCSVIFGIIYLIIVTFAEVFSIGYHQSDGIVGTDFLSIGIGMMLATIGSVKAQEALFPKGEAQGEGEKRYTPESRQKGRLLSGAPGVVLTAGGLFIYGFTALRTHFMVPLAGILVFAMGGMNIIMAVQIYALDGFGFPASAFAAISVFRCIFAGAFPLFGAKLFDTLGVNWGAGLLGFLALGLGLVLGLTLYIYGARFRKVGVKNMEWFIGKQNGTK